MLRCSKSVPFPHRIELALQPRVTRSCLLRRRPRDGRSNHAGVVLKDAWKGVDAMQLRQDGSVVAFPVRGTTSGTCQFKLLKYEPCMIRVYR